jgi:hypothetical protein
MGKGLFPCIHTRDTSNRRLGIVAPLLCTFGTLSFGKRYQAAIDTVTGMSALVVASYFLKTYPSWTVTVGTLLQFGHPMSQLLQTVAIGVQYQYRLVFSSLLSSSWAVHIICTPREG